MPATATDPWSSECRRALGRALVRRGEEPMSAAELAVASDRDPSNVKRAADALAARGALERRDPSGSAGRPGAKTKVAYAFAPGAREVFEAACGAEPEPGSLAPGDQLIFLDAAEPSAGLLECLARVEVSARLHWSALCDGERQELMIALRGPDAVNASLDLIGAFAAAKLKARRVTVAKIDSAAELASWATRSRKARDKGGRS